jgi:hypothetical protein
LKFYHNIYLLFSKGSNNIPKIKSGEAAFYFWRRSRLFALRLIAQKVPIYCQAALLVKKICVAPAADFFC